MPNPSATEKQAVETYTRMMNGARTESERDARAQAFLELVERQRSEKPRAAIRNVGAWLKGTARRLLRRAPKHAPPELKRVSMAISVVGDALEAILAYDAEIIAEPHVRRVLSGRAPLASKTSPTTGASYSRWLIWNAYRKVVATSHERPTPVDATEAVVAELWRHRLTVDVVEACRSFLLASRPAPIGDPPSAPGGGEPDPAALDPSDLRALGDALDEGLVRAYCQGSITPEALASDLGLPVGAIEMCLQGAWTTMRKARPDFHAFPPLAGAATMQPPIAEGGRDLQPLEALAVIAGAMGISDAKAQGLILGRRRRGRGSLYVKKSDGLRALAGRLGLPTDTRRSAALFHKPDGPQVGAEEALRDAAGAASGPREHREKVEYLRKNWFAPTAGRGPGEQRRSDVDQPMKRPERAGGGRDATRPMPPPREAIGGWLSAAEDAGLLHPGAASLRALAAPGGLAGSALKDDIEGHVAGCESCRDEVAIIARVRRNEEIREEVRAARARRSPRGWQILSGLALGVAILLLIPWPKTEEQVVDKGTARGGGGGFSSVALCDERGGERVISDGDRCPSTAYVHLQVALPDRTGATSVVICRVSPAACEFLPPPYQAKDGSVYWPLKGRAGAAHVLVVAGRRELTEGDRARIEANLNRSRGSFAAKSALQGIGHDRAISHSFQISD